MRGKSVLKLVLIAFCEPISGISSKTELKIKEFFNSKPYVLPTTVKENALKNKYILRDFIEKINS